MRSFIVRVVLFKPEYKRVDLEFQIAQFADPNLRRFNLIALDFRCHGLSIGRVPETYREADAAEDVFRFMVRSFVFFLGIFELIFVYLESFHLPFVEYIYKIGSTQSPTMSHLRRVI